MPTRPRCVALFAARVGEDAQPSGRDEVEQGWRGRRQLSKGGGAGAGDHAGKMVQRCNVARTRPEGERGVQAGSEEERWPGQANGRSARRRIREERRRRQRTRRGGGAGEQRRRRRQQRTGRQGTGWPGRPAGKTAVGARARRQHEMGGAAEDREPRRRGNTSWEPHLQRRSNL